MRNIVWEFALNYATAWWFAMLAARFCYSVQPESRQTRFWVFVHQQLWIGVPVALLLVMALAPATHSILDPALRTLSVAGYALWWWLTRNWPDDKWKRRGRRLKEKITAVRGKLVVVPATT